ncbi:MAG TPA: hypothetical protein VNB24_01045, partial [Acidimicrobiales bacterium]|nr:hypothetical protein [Acidimicrobiales bacterium]
MTGALKRRPLAVAAFAVLLASGLTATAQAAPVGNDDFVSAKPVVGTVYDTVDVTTATTETGEPVPSCGVVGHTVWYRAELPSAATVSVTTRNSDFDTLVAVHEGAAMDSLTERACADDGVGLQADLSVTLDPGVYMIQVGGAGTSAGELRATLRGAPEVNDPAGAPVNDAMSQATEIPALPFEVDVDLTNATQESDEPDSDCDYGSFRTVWFRYSPSQTTGLIVERLDESYDDSHISVFDAATLDLVRCEITYDGGSLATQVLAGRSYLIRVSGHD